MATSDAALFSKTLQIIPNWIEPEKSYKISKYVRDHHQSHQFMLPVYLWFPCSVLLCASWCLICSFHLVCFSFPLLLIISFSFSSLLFAWCLQFSLGSVLWQNIFWMLLMPSILKLCTIRPFNSHLDVIWAQPFIMGFIVRASPALSVQIIADKF